MNSQFQQYLHQSLQGISPARPAGCLVRRTPPVRDTKPAGPTSQQKKASRRAKKQARRR